tara:strand:+ start:1189 stop:1617 length:429 start_codon:yes stop_codon:yes gene_type:complete
MTSIKDVPDGWKTVKDNITEYKKYHENVIAKINFELFYQRLTKDDRDILENGLQKHINFLTKWKNIEENKITNKKKDKQEITLIQNRFAFEEDAEQSEEEVVKRKKRRRKRKKKDTVVTTNKMYYTTGFVTFAIGVVGYYLF